MADASILITAKDNYSAAVKKMQESTKVFGKDLDSMQSRLRSINTQKYKLSIDLKSAQNELKSIQKEMGASGEATEEMQRRFISAQESVDGLKSKMSLLASEAKNTEKHMRQLAETGKDTANNLGDTDSGSGKGLTAALKGLSQAGLFKQAGDAVADLAGQQLSSLYGDEAASAITSVISGAITGASVGSIGGIGIGTAIGAVVGGAAGGVQAITDKLQKNDDLYREYVQSQYDTWLDTQQQTLAEGTDIASGRENDRLSFTTLLGGSDQAAQLLSELQGFAAKTPFAYDDLTSASKALLSYGVKQGEILDYIGALGDAGSAVGLSGADIATLSTYLGRIKSNGKATQEYLNPLQERGIDVYGMLAEDIGISISELKSQISKGNVDGQRTVETLIATMKERFGGAMDAMSATYSGLTSTLEDTKAQLSAAQGDAYNEERKSGTGGISDQIAWYDAHMEQLKQGYSALGAYQASLENERDKTYMDAMQSAMETDAYQTAAAEQNGAEMGKILAEAQATAQNDYLNSDAYQLYEQTQIDIVTRLQSDAAVSEAWKMYGNHLAVKLNEGIQSGLISNAQLQANITPSHGEGGITEGDGAATQGALLKQQMIKAGTWEEYKLEYPAEAAALENSHAYGLNRVPYDNYPAMLHEGERVLTASEARAADKGSISGANININIASCTVRQESDIEDIVSRLYDKLAQAARGVL